MTIRKISVILLALVLTVVGLAGCKAEHYSRIRQSQLLGAIQPVEVQMKVEVASCNDFEDQSKPNESLVKANEIMGRIFPDSIFEGCKLEGMNSMATYITTMDVGTLPPDADTYESKGVSIIRNQNGVTFFCLSQEIMNEITEARKSPLTNDISLAVSTRLTNDTDKEITLFPHAVFADGTAFAGHRDWKNSISMKPKGSTMLVLSNVSSEYAIANGIVPIFEELVETSGDPKK